MNKMSPNEGVQDQLRVSSAGRTGGGCAQTPSGRLRSTEEDDRLLAAMAIADLANSLPVIAKSTPTNLPGKLLPRRSQPKPLPLSTYHTTNAPRILAESLPLAKLQTTGHLKRKPPSVAALASSKIAKITSRENDIKSITQSTFGTNNGNCSSDVKCLGYSAVSPDHCHAPLNPTAGVRVKHLHGLSCDMAREQGLKTNQEVVTNSSSAKESPMQVCLVHPTIAPGQLHSHGGHSLSSAAGTHTTFMTSLSEPLCISAPVTSLVQPQPVVAVARSSGGKVDNVLQGHQVDTENVAVVPTNGDVPLSLHTSVAPAMTTVHVTHSSDHEAKNTKLKKTIEDKKIMQTVSTVPSHHIDAMKLPLKKRKLLETHVQPVSPIVVTPHELQGKTVAQQPPAPEGHAMDRSSISPPPAKVRLVKVEQEKLEEGRSALRSGRDSGTCARL